ncbi:MAG: type II toxin-antitoxin system ParD family antitoxin [Alphaproteobacteria bacterium]|nr:type II toxin-antitoxin system ParD family antitoxin [Alphaproteobacteria bacterium]
MNVSLTPKLEEFVRQRIASGLYNNASEVIREALRLLIERTNTQTALPETPQKAKVRSRLDEMKDELRARGVTHLSLFGSVLHGDARSGSDVDILIDTAQSSHFSLIDLVMVKELLEEALGCPVDVVTRDGLEPALRKSVLRDAESIF